MRNLVAAAAKNNGIARTPAKKHGSDLNVFKPAIMGIRATNNGGNSKAAGASAAVSQAASSGISGSAMVGKGAA